MTGSTIGSAPSGENTSPDGTEKIPLTGSKFIQIANIIARKLRETAGPTTLSMGSITDGQYLKRSGTSIIGATVSSNAWTEVTDTWTYASANTITIPSDGTTVYKKGMGVRWKQGGSYKYASITIVASTLLTVTGGTDYTVANSAITDVAYTTSPKTAVGFPVTFTAAFPTWTLSVVDNGAGGQPSSTGATSYFTIDGNFCTYAVVMGNNNAQKVGTDNQIQFALPSTLPTPSDGTLMPGGVAYTVAAAVGVTGISLANGSNVDLRYSQNIADNATVPYTGCKITYKY